MISSVKQIEVPVIYDGEVFRPQEPVNLEPNTQYLIIVQVPLTEEDVNTDGDV
jgi:predicted DNA-binding antitoxin AbrB/MazE fold protein